MVSRTRVTRNKRANRVKKAGQKRKSRNRNKGSTPPFPVHFEKTSSTASPNHS